MGENNSKNYNIMSEKLKLLLKLDKNPVAVKLFESIDEAKKFLPKYEHEARHCQMVYVAAHENKSFYSTINEQSCIKGASVLGLIDNEMDVPQIEPIMNAVGYAPLKDANFDVDIVLIYCTMIQAFNFTNLYRKTTGKRINADFAGIKALCSEAIVIPMLNKKPNISLGCNGSRTSTGLRDDEMVIGLSPKDVEIITNFI